MTPKIELKLKDATDVAQEKVETPSISMKTEAEEGKKFDPMNEILERLSKLETENKALKEAVQKTDNKFINRRQKYDGPLKYSYKTWEGQPIVGYETISQTQERDWTKGGKYLVFTLIEITLANGKKVELDYDKWAQVHGKSEKLFVEETVDRRDGRYYVFNVDGNKFEVPEKLIN